MKILAFDTCFDACSVCVAELRDGLVSLSSRMERFETGHAERLIPMIGEAMDEAGLPFEKLDRIAVTIGPGTFTGTRIGIAAARSLALATNAQTVGVSSLAVMADVARREVTAETLAVVTDARRGEVYAQLFGPAHVNQTLADVDVGRNIFINRAARPREHRTHMRHRKRLRRYVSRMPMELVPRMQHRAHVGADITAYQRGAVHHPGDVFEAL